MASCFDSDDKYDLERLRGLLESARQQRGSSWVNNLIRENIHLRQRIHALEQRIARSSWGDNLVRENSQLRQQLHDLERLNQSLAERERRMTASAVEWQERCEQLRKQTWNAIQREVHEIARSKGWWDEDHGPHTTAAKLALIHAEVSEAAEAARRAPLNKSLGTAHGDPCHAEQDKHLPEFTAFEVELADVVIRTMDLAEARACRLREAIMAKIEFNKTRPVRHGGKGF